MAQEKKQDSSKSVDTKQEDAHLVGEHNVLLYALLWLILIGIVLAVCVT